MNNIKKCPKCGFMLTSDYGTKPYCLKCGYTEGIFLHDMSKYDTPESDLELFFKDKAVKYLYNKNNFLIFILGPLFYSYSGFFWIGMFLTLFSFRVGFLVYYNLGFIIFLIYFLFTRIIYMTFSNTIILWLVNLKIKLLKKYYKDYRNKIKKYKPTSILYVILAFLMALSLSIIFYL